MDNREEQIKHASSEYTKGIIGDSTIRAMDFENGAKWADENPIGNINKKWYVARDKNGDLYLYSGKPIKYIEEGSWDEELGALMYIENDEFPNVKWEDEEPTEVEFTIRKTKE